MTSAPLSATDNGFRRRFATRNDYSQLRVLSLSGCNQLIVVNGIQVSDVDPAVRHFVYRPITPAHPLRRIGIVLVLRGVVVPGGEHERRAFRQEWSGVVG